MIDIELGEVQAAFADIIWAHEPVGSGELVKICEKELGWKKPTTYTVLRKLCEKGLFKNEGGLVTALVS
ncbi:MAG: BlaI/MecI/CopY family transcriptional regulator, partial [Lachnospiraceae bacterium]|nr:BlaI/MecI/CopY family transcriptional regulator [Lachnospiraceae bacterium]